jgi:DNA-binding transcriptional MerR regulator
VFIFGSRARKRAKHLQRLKQVTHFLMKYVGLAGHCECMTTRDAADRSSHLLIIYTPQLIPAADREAMRVYFHRKLTDLGEISLPSLLLIIRDGNDLMRMRQQPEHVSSGRIATIIKAANEKQVALEQVEQRLSELRKQIAINRWQRQEDNNGQSQRQTWAMSDINTFESNPQPLPAWAMTNIGDIEPDAHSAHPER